MKEIIIRDDSWSKLELEKIQESTKIGDKLDELESFPHLLRDKLLIKR